MQTAQIIFFVINMCCVGTYASYIPRASDVTMHSLRNVAALASSIPLYITRKNTEALKTKTFLMQSCINRGGLWPLLLGFPRFTSHHPIRYIPMLSTALNLPVVVHRHITDLQPSWTSYLLITAIAIAAHSVIPRYVEACCSTAWHHFAYPQWVQETGFGTEHENANIDLRKNLQELTARAHNGASIALALIVYAAAHGKYARYPV